MPRADPVTYGVLALMLLLMTTLASWILARRAASIEPISALHDG